MISYRTVCPSCRDKGGDTSGDNLCVYNDGGAHCHACSYHDNNFGKKRKSPKVEEKKPKRQFNLKDFESLPFGPHPMKPLIHPGFLQKANTRIGCNPQTGQQETVHYAYYNPVTKKQEAEKVKFPPDRTPRYAISGPMNRCGLYRQQITPEGGRLLIITEGEDDANALDHLLRRAGKDYGIVSLPNGADENGKLDKQVLSQLEYLCSFNLVVLCFDNDHPGITTAEALAERLHAMTKTKIVPVQHGKDAYELLEACEGNPEAEEQAGKDYLKKLWSTSEHSPEDVIAGEDLTLEDLFTEPVIGYPLPWPGLQEKMRGLRPGEVTLIVAGPGVGKSTLSRAIAYHMRKHIKLRVANIFLEDGWQKAAQAYIALDWKVPLNVLRENPDILTVEQKEQTMRELFWNGGIYFHKHWGSIQSEKLITRLRYYALACECQLGILDHISIVTSGNETNNERKDIDVLMTNLTGMAVETGMHVLAICHLKRGEKSFNEGAPISINDLRGSSSLEGLSSNIIAAERDQQAEGSVQDTLRLRLLKCREIGKLGPCGSLFYQHKTGLLLPMEATI